MTDPLNDDDEDTAPNRPRWIGWAIVILMLMIAFGVANVGWLIFKRDPAQSKQDAALQVISRRLKQAYDPAGIFQPQRMGAGG